MALLLAFWLLTSMPSCLPLSLGKVQQQLPYVATDKHCPVSNTTYDDKSDLCCSKCPTGRYVAASCTEGRDTECRECPPGTYMEAWNYLRKCFSCRGPCVAELGLTQFQDCTARSRRVCVCAAGTFCKTGVDETTSTCSQCHAHSACPPGHGVDRAGDFRKDTVCKRCQNGTFSNATSSTDPCQPHANCSRLGLETQIAGSAISDAKCQPGRLGQEGPLGQTATDSTSVSLAVISGVLLVFIVLSSYCVMLDLNKYQTLQLSCFKWVFKACNAHPEPETGNEILPEDLRTEELLGPVVRAQCDPSVEGVDSVPVEREALRSQPSRPCPVPEVNSGIPEGTGSPVRPPLQTEDRRSPGLGKETPKESGIIGPVYIYNPSRVYVGVISDQRSSQRSLRGREDSATDDGILRYPQEEQGAPQRESGHLPEQESGKESHLPVSASDDP